jgi:hypothetical protein
MLALLRRALGEISRQFRLGSEQTHLYSMNPPAPALALAPAGLSWAHLSPENMAELSELGPFDLAVAARRFERGDHCYGCYLDGKLAHYSWVQQSGQHPIEEAGVSRPLAPGEFWIYHCRTADWARGRGIYPATLARIVSEFFDAGYQTAWIYTTRHNISSQKGIGRAGFRMVTTFKAFRCGPRYFPLGTAGGR